MVPTDSAAAARYQAWLLLSLVLSPARLRALWEAGASLGQLQNAVGELPAAALKLARPQMPRLLDWSAQDGNQLLPLYSPDYPELLATLSDPPPVLYLQGLTEALHLPQLAIVGTRKPSADGRRLAQEFAAALTQAGFVITSGLALGIDTQSHASALQSDGRTVAVLGSGLDQIYPRSNRGLAQQIREQGVLVSEFPPWEGPLAWHFPQRNRVISGLSYGVLVIEAAQRSGSLITARLAADQGREVFAIPGSVYNPQSRGCHALLRKGAKLVETLEDILEELPALIARQRQYLPLQAGDDEDGTTHGDQTASGQQDRALLNAIGYGPCSLEQLQLSTGRDAAGLLAGLVELELQGLVSAVPEGWTRAGHAPGRPRRRMLNVADPDQAPQE